MDMLRLSLRHLGVHSNTLDYEDVSNCCPVCPKHVFCVVGDVFRERDRDWTIQHLAERQ